MGDGGRIIDIGGLVAPEEDYEGRALIIFAIDPGYTTGWSALKVPVGLLSGLGVTRTLARCRWRHGQVLRSGAGQGTLHQGISDSAHVNDILSVARTIYDEWFFDSNEMLDDHSFGYEHGWESDVFVIVSESFSLRLLSQDPTLLAPVRVNSLLIDRMVMTDQIHRLFFQSPSDAKNVVTDARLKSWAMYRDSSGPHARDADRHAILFLRKFAESRDLREKLGFGRDEG